MSTATAKSPINRLISAIGWQAIILLTVWYATVQANDIAGTMLYIYSIVLALVAIMYTFLLAVPMKTILRSPNLRDSMPKRGAVFTSIRVIAAMVTIVEVALFWTHGFYYLAAMWIIVELIQLGAVYRVTTAMKLREELDTAIEQCMGRGTSLKAQLLQTSIDKLEREMAEIVKDIPEGDVRDGVIKVLQERYDELALELVAEVMRENEEA